MSARAMATLLLPAGGIARTSLQQVSQPTWPISPLAPAMVDRLSLRRSGRVMLSWTWG